MTEAEWLEARHADPLLRFIEPKVSDRKLHYFAIACARRIAPLLPDPRSLHGVDVLERFVEGLCQWEDAGELDWEVEAAAFAVGVGYAPWQEAAEQLPDSLLAELIANPDYTFPNVRHVFVSAAYFVDRIFNPVPQERRFRELRGLPSDHRFQPVSLVHEIFANPFHLVKMRRAWRTDTVLALARQMYDSGDFFAMPILADALQDAGCDSSDILNHCRGPGPHVRGCWAVDLVLGKE